MKPSQRTDIMPPEVLTHFWEAALSRCCGGKATQGLVENKSIFVIDSNITWQPVPRSEFAKFDFLGWCDSLLLLCGILNELVTPTGERERERERRGRTSQIYNVIVMNGGAKGFLTASPSEEELDKMNVRKSPSWSLRILNRLSESFYSLAWLRTIMDGFLDQPVGCDSRDGPVNVIVNR